MSGPQFIQDFVEFLPGSTAVGYGTLIFLGFFFLAFFQGLSEYSCKLWATKFTRFTHGRNKVVDIGGVIVLRYEANRTDNGFV